MSTFPRGPVSLLIMTGGVIVWSVCFVVLYGGMSLACTQGWFDVTLAGLHGINWMLVVLWVAHLVLLALMTWVSLGHLRMTPREDASTRFGWRTTFVLNVVGLAGTVWIGFPILMTVPCI
ncbi:hypothetical protein IMZ29_12530 [Achromobacter sp. GG226]|uniref:hypothetical protein n=1 Tax=Verticiella alkaliphila TaxID=2779529 RepID=UPI001C0E3A40|nr:hypothetical protein [Verticiella sp. GG226]MBU4611326.1 hypothetical protein [Verticiella sp. GG226]